MSFANLGAHWWVILIIVVLLFGAPKLPALARSLGQSMRIFRSEIKNGAADDKVESTEAGDSTANSAGNSTAKPAPKP